MWAPNVPIPARSSSRRLLSSDAVEQTRALAAEALGSFDSAEAAEALATAAKQRWGTSTVVKDAASRALMELEARRQSGGTRSGATLESAEER